MREDLDQRRLVELVQRADDRQAADELRDQAVLDQIFRLDHLERRADVAVLTTDFTSALKPSVFLPMRRSICLSRPTNAPPQMNRMLVVSTWKNSWCGCLRPPCGGTLATVPFEDLQQRLLDAFARDVAGDRRVLVLAADLVDLVDVDDALLALLDVAAGRLQQLEDDVLDVLADVAGLGQRRRVDDREGDREELGEGLREQRLAGAGRADQQDVRLGELDLVAAARLLLDLDPLVVVVDRDRELLLGLFLADDVLVEELLDFLRDRQRRAGAAARLEPVVVGDDVVADLDALVADEDRRARNQLADVVLVLVAERAAEDLAFAGFFDHGLNRVPFSSRHAGGCSSPSSLRMTSSIIPYSLPWSAPMM